MTQARAFKNMALSVAENSMPNATIFDGIRPVLTTTIPIALNASNVFRSTRVSFDRGSLSRNFATAKILVTKPFTSADSEPADDWVVGSASCDSGAIGNEVISSGDWRRL